MPRVCELYEFLNSKFPSSYSCEWDNDGLMLADDPGREVIRVLCTLDVTDEAIDYAIEHSYDVIVSHHPMIFKPLKSVSYADPVGRKVLKLLRHRISVMSFHTRLDAAPGGLNDVFANLLGLTDVTVLECDGEAIGRIGTLPEEYTCATFAAFAKKTVSAERVLFSEAGGAVRRVAICGGDGKDFVKAAKAAGADSYLTGQLSYNIMEEAGSIGLNLFEAGHFATEDFICSYLTLLILKKFTQVQTGYFNSNNIKAI
ncbi:MAG: Nif3-like dinuclear metal center hexameric protein [Clostridia bacterium]|nr:Nif3-like dinuclear metal center hexameric protein [Clostridia bacterium]